MITDLPRKSSFQDKLDTHLGPVVLPPSEFKPKLEMSAPVQTAATTHVVETPGHFRVHILPAIEDVSAEQSLAASITSQLNGKIERLYNLNLSEMFNSGIPGERSMLERRAMLLYHPEEHTEEIELITRWLLTHEVEVANLWYDGAWSHFQRGVVNGKTGVIIVRSIS